MGMGTSLFLLAIGAILTYAVNVQTAGHGAVNVHTLGVILMSVGILGVVLSAIFWSSWGGWRHRNGPLP